MLPTCTFETRSNVLKTQHSYGKNSPAAVSCQKHAIRIIAIHFGHQLLENRGGVKRISDALDREQAYINKAMSLPDFKAAMKKFRSKHHRRSKKKTKETQMRSSSKNSSSQNKMRLTSKL